MVRACVEREVVCLELSWMESGSWRVFRVGNVNPANPVYGDKTGSKLEWKLDWKSIQ